ncbi:MAG: alpha-amylase [Opitutae bacterium]|nr:alpha-amylase [Opitutae bacterium]
MRRQQITVFLSLLLALSPVYGKIEHVEPPFWWTGMKRPSLQVLVHGPSIGKSDVSLQAETVLLKSVVRVENPNYLFLNLELAPETEPGSFPIQFKKDGQTVAEYRYELRARKPNASQVEGFNSSDVIYLITPDRFANGDPGNDRVAGMRDDSLDRNHPLSRHGGDLKGIRQHLDYIADMGFTAVWMNPVLENNQPRYSYHGYGITDFYRVDPRFGSNEEYGALCQASQANGLKMVKDMIFNHCGEGHWWMNDLPSSDWINYLPEKRQTNHKRTTLQDPYAAKSDYELMRDGWFVSAMPDLNQRNPLVAEYLIQNSIWWIEYLGLAGIRMDTLPYADKYMMADWTRRLLDEYPRFNVVGEEWSINPLVIAYWQKGKANRDGYASDLPSLMDFPLQNTLASALQEEESWSSGLIKLYEILTNDVLYPDPNNLVIFGDNHDMPRLYMQLGKDVNLMKNAMVYLLTMRGIPQIYYGTEILMTHEEGNDHGHIRKDFPGGWKNDTVNAFTGEKLPDHRRSFQEFVRGILHWRKEQPAIHRGQLTHFVPKDGIYVYFRYDDRDTIMVVINKNEENTSLDLTRFETFLGNHSEAYDVVGGNVIPLEAKLPLQALTPYILKLQ